ncbi:hypothetical protein Tco_0932360, partial [Tanacetum coccineum]
RSVSIRCQGYIGDFVLGCLAKDMVALSFDEELEGPMKDQPLSTDASPTTLLLGYIADSNPEEDKKDPEEDPKDEEEEEHLASADPSAVPTDDPVPSS